MQTVIEIENAIGRLPREEMFKLLERLETKAGDTWDLQIEQDVREGRLDLIAQQAIAEHRAGKSTNFPADAE